MFAISVLSAFINVFILVLAVRFFRTAGPIRESDKTSVACIASLSVLFLMACIAGWGAHTPVGFSSDLGRNMIVAYNLAVSIVFMAQLQLVTTRKALNQCQLG